MKVYGLSEVSENTPLRLLSSTMLFSLSLSLSLVGRMVGRRSHGRSRTHVACPANAHNRALLSSCCLALALAASASALALAAAAAFFSVASRSAASYFSFFSCLARLTASPPPRRLENREHFPARVPDQTPGKGRTGLRRVLRVPSLLTRRGKWYVPPGSPTAPREARIFLCIEE